MSRSFAVTWDYLCPFARNAHEHVIAALEDGADWDVRFVPFSLSQVHIEEGDTPVWDRDDALEQSGILALAAGLAVRDLEPGKFLAAHCELFSARHDDGADIRDHAVVRQALERAGADAEEILAHVRGGEPLETLRKEHSEVVDDYAAFGVPTFVAAGDAVFVRLMHRPQGDPDLARRTVEQVLDLLVEHPQLNEFKRTRSPR